MWHKSKPPDKSKRMRAEILHTHLKARFFSSLIDDFFIVKNSLDSDYPPQKKVAFTPIHGFATENSLHVKGKAKITLPPAEQVGFQVELKLKKTNGDNNHKSIAEGIA